MNRDLNERVQAVSTWIKALRTEIGGVIVGQEALIDRLLVGLLANGHVLLEGVPGLAKTLSVRTLAAAIQASFRRIQFIDHTIVDRVLHSLLHHPDARRGVRLRIGIDQQHFFFQNGQAGGQIDGRSRFPYSTFLIRNGYNFSHDFVFGRLDVY